MIRNRFNILAPWQPSQQFILLCVKANSGCYQGRKSFSNVSSFSLRFSLISSFIFTLSHIALGLCTRYAGSLESQMNCWKDLFDAWIVIQNKIGVDGYKIAVCRALSRRRSTWLMRLDSMWKKAWVKNYRNHFIFFICTFFSLSSFAINDFVFYLNWDILEMVALFLTYPHWAADGIFLLQSKQWPMLVLALVSSV